MPSSILVDFNGQRKAFEASDEAVPWQKVVEVVVGRAPTVDVILKSDTEEFRVKTFKFKTEKRRRVVITVDVDASHNSTASLLTVEADGVAIDAAYRHEMVTLDSNAECYLYTKTSETVIVTRASPFGATLEQLDAAATAAAAIAPPTPGRVAVIVPYTCDYITRQRMYQAMKTVGYTEIHCPEVSSPHLSSALHGAKPKQKIGDLIGVIVNDEDMVMVCRKTDNEYAFVEHIPDARTLRRFYPEVKQIVGFLSSSYPVPKEKLREFVNSYAPIPIQFVNYEGSYMLPYLWDKVEGGNMDGYLVKMTTQCSFRICYKKKESRISAESELLPWQKTVKINIGDAPEVNVFMKFYDKEVHVKQFKFKTKKDRKVLISIAMDDARLPRVELVTL